MEYLLVFIILMLATLLYVTNMQAAKKSVTFDPVVRVEHIPPTPPVHPAPYKVYKPPGPQQMGVVKGENGEILPLYGEQSYAHRDRYHYYTVTPGNQAYSLPVHVDERDCTDDIGCQELYGNDAEKLQITGMDGEFTPVIYRNKFYGY